MQRLFSFSNILKTLVLITGIFVLFAHIFSPSAHAQSLVSDETTQRALKIAETIKRDNLIARPPKTINDLKLDELSPEAKLKALRINGMNAVFYRNDLPQDELFSLYREEALKQKNERDIKISKIFILQKKLQNTDLTIEPGKSNHRLLTKYGEDPDWFVAQRAALMESSLQNSARNYSAALRDAQNALSLIPNELTDAVFEAQFETYDYISYLQIVQNNIDLAIATTEQVIEKGQQQKRNIDGVALLNNMIYAFNVWHEYDIAETLAKTLLDTTKQSGTGVDSLAYFRYGEAQNTAQHYGPALETLNIAARHTQNIDFLLGIEADKAISLAGLGRIKDARKSFRNFDRLAKKHDKDTAGYKDVRLRAQALIALASGDAASAHKISNARSKNTIQRLLKFQTSGVQKLHADLQNNKERQAEREAGLKREAVLKQKELDALKRSRSYLLALLVALALIALTTTYVAILRGRVAVSMQETIDATKISEKAKKQFLSVMSHELRTPLNGIIGISDYIVQSGETQALRDQGNIILESGNNLLDLLTGILDMSQMDTDNLEIITVPTNAHQLANTLYNEWKAKVDHTKIQMSCYVDPNVPDDLMLDTLRVKQCLKNLISNGVKFTQEGRIHIHITMEGQKDTREKTLKIIVADTGQGVSPDMQDKLFKPFLQADASMTRSHGGAGVGLTVTRGLARLMGGDITLNTRVGGGSEFQMTVTTMSAAEAEREKGTNRPIFKVQKSAKPVVDFEPAISLEEIQTRNAQRKLNTTNSALHGLLPPVGRQSDVPTDNSDVPEKQKGEVSDFELIGDNLTQRPPEVALPFETPKPQEKEQGQKSQDVFDMGSMPQETVQVSKHRGIFSRRKARQNDTSRSYDELRGLNILVVEDILVNQEILRSLLEPVGCKVACADHGGEALDLMKNQIFDVILMDIRMPIMDGIEATQAIRALTGEDRNTPIIALTADVHMETNAQCLAAGADVFLTKPIVVSELFSSIRFVRKKLDYNKDNKVKTA